MKLCKDCKHFREEFSETRLGGSITGRGVTLMGRKELYSCVRFGPSADPVLGEPIFTSALCKDERATLPPHGCGLEGKYWETK